MRSQIKGTYFSAKEGVLTRFNSGGDWNADDASKQREKTASNGGREDGGGQLCRIWDGRRDDGERGNAQSNQRNGAGAKEVGPGGKEKLEPNDAFAKRLEAELKPEVETLWRMCVEYSPAGASAFDAGLKKWLAEAPKVQPNDGSARALVRVCAVAATKRLLDVWAETTMGRTWDDFLKMTQLETEAKVLEEVIEPGQPEVVRAKTLAFLRAHETLYGKADTPVKVKLAVSALLSKLDKNMVETAPGKTEASKLLTTSKEALADAVSDAADKAARATPQTKTQTKAAAPTEEMREPQQREREERPARTRELICFACHKEGHFAKDCRAGQEESRQPRQVAEQDRRLRGLRARRTLCKEMPNAVVPGVWREGPQTPGLPEGE